ncbi:MAG: hydroxyacid dehydrogenase [Ruminococcaceae bacterium]|nr:hydroxyacid dehydrogenase [Oscillospiraceae bacterium]
MKIKILDAATLGEGLDFSVLSRFGEVESFDGTAKEDVAVRIADADVIIINKIKINSESLRLAKRLKLVCIFATGYDNINIDDCREKGIAVCNVKGYSTHSVAQLTVLMALNLIEKISDYTEFVKDGEYTKSGIANRLIPINHELYGKTWGIVGAGAIGKQVAKVANAFGCNVLAFKRTPDETLNCVSLDTLLKESDIISLHTPLNEGTRGLIGERELGIMKKDAILINVARGAVTDENAVANAVLDGEIGAFATDVYSVEPFGADHPMAKIMHCKNVMLTPHMAWGALEARVRCLDEIMQNIESFLSGGKRNRVDV